MKDFIDQYRDAYGVEPICKVLQIAPSWYRRHAAHKSLAETINGLYKAELIHRRAPWKTKESVELATLEWVAWFNTTDYSNPSGKSSGTS